MEFSSHCLFVSAHAVQYVYVVPLLFINYRMGNLEAVKLLREAGCDPFAGNSEGWTPIHIASWYIDSYNTFSNHYDVLPSYY